MGDNNSENTEIQVIKSALKEVKKADRFAETDEKIAAEHYLEAISKLKAIKCTDDSRASEVAEELLTHVRHHGKLLIEDSSLSNAKNIDDYVSEIGIREALDTGKWTHRTSQSEESIVQDVRKKIVKADQLQYENSYDEAISLYKEARRAVESRLTNNSGSRLSTEIGVGLRQAQKNKRTAERPTPKEETPAPHNRTQTNESANQGPSHPGDFPWLKAPNHGRKVPCPACNKQITNELSAFTSHWKENGNCPGPAAVSEQTWVENGVDSIQPPPNTDETGDPEDTDSKTKKYKYSPHNYHARKGRNFGRSYYEFNTKTSLLGLFSNSYTLHVVDRWRLIAVEKPTGELVGFSGWESESMFFGFQSSSSGCPVSEKADKIVPGKPEVRLDTNMQQNLPHQIEKRGHYHGVVIELRNDTIAAPNDIKSVKRVFSQLDGITISSNTNDLAFGR